jgi:5-(carboxyamino)imidazole ribonucleotide synthase
MDLCDICQFENHIRAVCDMNILKPTLTNFGKMINLIGEDSQKIVELYINNPNAKVYLYSKKDIKPARKVGHINIIGNT